MKLLLDTHVLLWWGADDRRLRAAARAQIARADVVYVSAATAWEIAIKVALGRLRPPEPVKNLIRRSAFQDLAITVDHAEHAGQLPRHHGDPFDRMLVAQAQLDGLTLMTHDRPLEQYQVAIEWV